MKERWFFWNFTNWVHQVFLQEGAKVELRWMIAWSEKWWWAMIHNDNDSKIIEVIFTCTQKGFCLIWTSKWSLSLDHDIRVNHFVWMPWESLIHGHNAGRQASHTSNCSSFSIQLMFTWLTVMTMRVKSTLNAAPPSPLRALTTPRSTAGTLRPNLGPCARAPRALQGPHVQLARGRRCHHPGVRGEAGCQQGEDDQQEEGWPPPHRHHAWPLLASPSTWELHSLRELGAAVHVVRAWGALTAALRGRGEAARTRTGAHPHNEEMGERGTDVGFWAHQGQSCEMDLSKLIYGFLWVVTWICRTGPAQLGNGWTRNGCWVLGPPRSTHKWVRICLVGVRMSRESVVVDKAIDFLFLSRYILNIISESPFFNNAF